MNSLNFNYNIGAKTVLYDPDIGNKLAAMKAAGVSVIWLFYHFYGHFNSTLQELQEAKKILEANGFEVQAINVPLGHGGNAFDPDDNSLDLSLIESWNNRVDIDGRRLSCCACIDEKVLTDSRNAALGLKDAGITKIFYDDDLRLAHWGKNVQGCFCGKCIEQFNLETGAAINRDSLKAAIYSEYKTGSDRQITEAWINFSCEKIIRFLKEVTVEGIKSGIMVMHNGDRRHGIDIKKIRTEIPGTFIRVGEGHFDNKAFEHEDAQASLKASISTHIALSGDVECCYSESTIYPKFALSPRNWIEKIKLEISLGLRNIYLMSGTWYITPEYWAALREARPELEALAKNTPEPKHEVMPFVWQI